jgi:UDP-N-acetylglucosamine 2-epimerase (non-hydrolysing)
MTKVVCICGTRPELIRLSEVIKKLDLYTNHIFVHTNQSYDYELNQVFFDELKIRKPDYLLNVKAETIGEQIGNIMTQTEKVLLKENPDAVLILGDTNSALSCIVAKRLHIPIFHMEAGNRSFSDLVPEEVNRRIIDHTADCNLPYTEHARRNLLREGIHPQFIFVTGSPLTEVYANHIDEIYASDILKQMGLTKDNYIVASLHREENITDWSILTKVIEAFYTLSEKYKMPVIFSTHPRTRAKLNPTSDDRIIFHKPFGLFEFIKLQQNAFITISDSGTINEDSAILGIPTVNIRESQERYEVYDSGNCVISGLSKENIINCVDLVRKQINVNFKIPHDYIDKNCSDKVIRLIMGYTGIIKKKIYGE